MGWAVGFDTNWNRDIGYGVPSICDHPDCMKEIDRGLGYVCCDQESYGGPRGCGLFFCEEHSSVSHICERCEVGGPPFEPTPDTEEWKQHKKTDLSWAKWRKENPVEAEAL